MLAAQHDLAGQGLAEYALKRRAAAVCETTAAKFLSRKDGLVDQGHGEAGPGRGKGRRGARWTAADDHHIKGFGIS